MLWLTGIDRGSVGLLCKRPNHRAPIEAVLDLGDQIRRNPPSLKMPDSRSQLVVDDEFACYRAIDPTRPEKIKGDTVHIRRVVSASKKKLRAEGGMHARYSKRVFPEIHKGMLLAHRHRRLRVGVPLTVGRPPSTLRAVLSWATRSLPTPRTKTLFSRSLLVPMSGSIQRSLPRLSRGMMLIYVEYQRANLPDPRRK